MKLFYTFVITLFVSLEMNAQCASTTNIYLFNYAGKSYEIVKEVKNWTNASACAVARGGYLVQINTAAEDSVVYNAITVGAAVSSTYASAADGGGIAYVWIGATDRQTEGTWLWDGDYNNTGTNFWTGQGSAGAGTGAAIGGNYVNWGGTSLGTAEEPDDYIGIQDCGAIGLNTWPHGIAGEWNDISGLNNMYYVIEYDTLLGIIDNEQKFQSIIYPNPSGDLITISGANSNNQFSSCKVMNQMGAMILSEENVNASSITLNVSEYSEGIYYAIIFFSDGISETRKISVVK